MTDADTQKDTKIVDPKSNDTNANEDSAKVQAEQIRSANAWEKADLGDEERKNKFLRLMGAAKKEHHGKFIIGDHKPDHARGPNDTEKLQHELEDQYEQSMQHRLASGRRGHLGLGYHEDDKATDPPRDSEAKEKKDEDSEKDSGDASPDKEGDGKDNDRRGSDAGGTSERRDRKRDSADFCSKQDVPDEKKMKFVKGSS